MWITGWIINSGNYDISERTVEVPLTLTLPENLQWSSVKVPHCSNDVKCEVEIVERHKLRFRWSLLRGGEFIYFDALLRCPIDESNDQLGKGFFAKTVNPYSRIENIRNDSIVSLSQIGDRYNPKKTRERHFGLKALATCFVCALYIPFFMRLVYPFALDQFFGDGFLSARPVIESTADDVSIELAVSVNGHNKIRLECPQSAENQDVGVCGRHVFDSPTEVFANKDLRVSKFVHRDRMKEPDAVFLLGAVTVFAFWIVIYMWFPGLRLFGSKRRRTASALYALQKRKPDTNADST